MGYRALNQRAVSLTYGQRALTIGATHPRLFQGTAQSTASRNLPLTRLALTARLFETVFLGDKAEADRALAFTATRHATVNGTIDEDAGPQHPAGAPYDAYDPGLMWWTAAFTLDAVEVQHDHLVRRLKDRERQALFEDFVTWAELFGMPRSAAPSDYADFRAGFDGFLASDEPFVTEEAKLVGQYLSGAKVPNPAPLPARPVLSAIHTVVIGGLSAKIRDLFDLEWSVLDEARFQSIALASRTAHQRVPFFSASPLMRGRAQEFYKIVARGEQHVVRRGRASMPGVSDRAS